MKTLQMCLDHARVSQHRLSEAFQQLAKRHERDYDVYAGCKLFAEWSQGRERKLKPFCERYGTSNYCKGVRVGGNLFGFGRTGGYGLLRDLEDLLLLAHDGRVAWTVLGQAAKEMKDAEMKEAAEDCSLEAEREIDWMCTQIKNTSPQVLTVPEGHEEGDKSEGLSKVRLTLGMGLIGLIGVTALSRFMKTKARRDQQLPSERSRRGFAFRS